MMISAGSWRPPPEIKSYDERGRPELVLGTVQNITEQKLAEEKSAEQIKQFQVLLDAFPCVALLLRPSTREIVYANRTSMNAGAIIGKTCYESWGKRTDPCPWCQTLDMKSTGEVQQCEVKGDGLVWDISWIPITDDLFLHYAFDITETVRLRELEGRAQRLESAGQVAGQVAHDFNNLLAPLVAYPEFIRELLPEDHPALPYLSTIEKSSQQIAEINQQLLTLGRRGNHNHVPLDLNSIISQLSEDLKPPAETQITRFDLQPDLDSIIGSEAQICRIITNLINNAYDSIEASGHVTIHTENLKINKSTGNIHVPPGDYVKLTVSDTGYGIPDSTINKIFDPFFTTKICDKKKGSGLGLSVVHAVTKDHNGFLDVSSKVNEGTSFYVYFPADNIGATTAHSSHDTEQSSFQSIRNPVV